MPRVDGINFALKAAVQKILQNGSAYGTGTIRRTDDGHRPRSEHRIEAVLLQCHLFVFLRCLSHHRPRLISRKLLSPYGCRRQTSVLKDRPSANLWVRRWLQELQATQFSSIANR